MKWFMIGIAMTGLVSQAVASEPSTLVLQPGPEAGKDAWVWSWEPARDVNFGRANESNHGLHNVVRAETWRWGDRARPDHIRSFIAFDLNDIPAGASILEATLSLRYYANPGFTPQLGDNAIRVQIVSESWLEDEVTWNHQPTVANEPSVTAEVLADRSSDLVDLDVRNLVQEMVYFPDRTHGFSLRLEAERPYNGATFASSDHVDESLRPRLVIEYITH